MPQEKQPASERHSTLITSIAERCIELADTYNMRNPDICEEVQFYIECMLVKLVNTVEQESNYAATMEAINQNNKLLGTIFMSALEAAEKRGKK